MPSIIQRRPPASRALGALPAIACASALLLGPTTAGAFLTTSPVQTIDFCLNCSGSPVVVDSEFNISQTITGSNTFGAFDTSLGTLQSVRFAWVTGVQGNLTSSFVDPDVPSASLSLNVAIGLPGLLPSSTMASAAITENATLANGQLTATIDQAFSGNRTYSVPADLSHFIGNGTFGVDFSLALGVQSNNATVFGTGSWASPTGTATPGHLTLEYTYDALPTINPTPEPGTIALGLLAAVVGIGYHRRSRRNA